MEPFSLVSSHECSLITHLSCLPSCLIHCYCFCVLVHFRPLMLPLRLVCRAWKQERRVNTSLRGVTFLCPPSRPTTSLMLASAQLLQTSSGEKRCRFVCLLKADDRFYCHVVTSLSELLSVSLCVQMKLALAVVDKEANPFKEGAPPMTNFE